MYSNKYKITGIESGNILALFWATHRQLQHIKKCSYLLVGKGRGVGGPPPPPGGMANGRRRHSPSLLHILVRKDARQLTVRPVNPFRGSPSTPQPHPPLHTLPTPLPRSLRRVLACYFQLKMCGVNCTSTATCTHLRPFLYTNFISIHLKYV